MRNVGLKTKRAAGRDLERSVPDNEFDIAGEQIAQFLAFVRENSGPTTGLDEIDVAADAAPENIGLKPHQFTDEEAHDRFALATIVFMLLNRGIHPYQGVLNSEIPGAETTAGKIKHNLYPYGAGKGKITPHEKSLYRYWPEELKNMFDGAFAGPGQGPSAEEWYIYFNLLSSQAEPCKKNPKYHLKYALVGCPNCQLNKNSPRVQPPPTSPPHLRQPPPPPPARTPVQPPSGPGKP